VCAVIAALCPTDNGSASAPVSAGVGANLADHQAGVSVTVSPSPAVAVTVDTTTIGAPAPTPDQPGVTVHAGPVSQTVPLAGL
jgi:hypothetical protein